MTVFLLSLGGIYLYVAWMLLSFINFKRQRDKIPFRVHINGIRGKSTVTRYVSAIFREAGYYAFGKTTGSAARIILANGQDYDFERRGYPNVNEQVNIIKRFSKQNAEAVIVECMAVNPVYAKWLEDKVMQSHVGILTNVRYDHPDYLGETLEEIADSLSNTIPENGTLITSEYNPKLLSIIWKNAKKKNAKVIVAEKGQVAPGDIENFAHFAHEENVAIGYEIAKMLNLPKDRALKAMQSAPADPGAFSIQYLKYKNTTIAWANLFAVNDRESFIEVCEKLFNQLSSYTRVVLLNNRPDRPARVELFSNLAKELAFDKSVTLGEYEKEVNRIFAGEEDKLINLGFSTQYSSASGEELIEQIVSQTQAEKILLIGAVNIHTEQAERILHYFEEELSEEPSDSE